MGGKGWLLPPKWFLKKLGDNPGSNVSGLDFRKDEENNHKKGKKSKASKVVGTGRKLGTSKK